MSEPEGRDHVVARAATVRLVVDEDQVPGFEAAAQDGLAKPDIVRGPDGRVEGNGRKPRAGGDGGRQGLFLGGPAELPETEPRKQQREAQGRDAETDLGAPPAFRPTRVEARTPPGARLA
jgi:hypothetical protein